MWSSWPISSEDYEVKKKQFKKKTLCEWKRSLFSHRLNISTDSKLLLQTCNLFLKKRAHCLRFFFFLLMNERSRYCSDELYRHLSPLRGEFEWKDAKGLAPMTGGVFQLGLQIRVQIKEAAAVLLKICLRVTFVFSLNIFRFKNISKHHLSSQLILFIPIKVIFPGLTRIANVVNW